MLRFARLLVIPLALAARASSAQTPAPAAAGSVGTPAEPVLERRAMPAPGGMTNGVSVSPSTTPDPWLVSYAGLSGRTTRTNIAQLDHALEPYRTTYTRLPADDRARLRQAFDELFPSQRFNRYPLGASQARAIAYLALGPSEAAGRDRDCGGPRRRGGHSRCDQSIDSMGRHAAWIHSTILSMGRTGSRRPRTEELASLRAMSEYAREMVVGASGCGCPAARDDSEALLGSTREAADVYEGSSMPARLSLGDQRVQRISRLADSLERTFLRCLGEN
ncbi:MAG TPA: hypothetical protein VMY76_03050 [Gemmatimonadales bacterium]|nr:hypothetical protein [Gemmatimonadales bacterium]